ncbi:MAG: hypothetical protein JST16_19205 [Bdellovibrionales bacterium]|nr:hypothetical protein [Bdellovibrionales bacterium]
MRATVSGVAKDKMNNTLRRFFLGSWLAFSFLAWGGNDVGHGGGAWVKRDSAGNVIDAQFLDLWEGPVLEGLTMLKSQDNQAKQIEAALVKLDRWNPAFSEQVRREYNDLSKILIYLPPDVGLAAPTDINSDLTYRGYQLEGVAQYREASSSSPERQLLINSELLNRLPPRDQAALWIHEAVYKVLRDWPNRDADSVRTRRLVARLFSTTQPASVFEGMAQAPGLECSLSHEDNGTYFSFPRGAYFFRKENSIRIYTALNKNGWNFGPSSWTLEGEEKPSTIDLFFAKKRIDLNDLSGTINRIYGHSYGTVGASTLSQGAREEFELSMVPREGGTSLLAGKLLLGESDSQNDAEFILSYCESL